MDSEKEGECIDIRTEMNILENGREVDDMEMENYGHHLARVYMRENGSMEGRMEKEY